MRHIIKLSSVPLFVIPAEARTREVVPAEAGKGSGDLEI